MTISSIKIPSKKQPRRIKEATINLMSLLIEKSSKDNTIKEDVIRKNKKKNKNDYYERFEKFLKMNTYDLALENPSKAYHFLLKEVMETNRKSIKEKQESFKRLLMEIVELLEKNEYLKVAKTLLTHLKTLKNQNEFIDTEQNQHSGSLNTLNENENDFNAWLKAKENRILINFAYSFCLDGERKKATSFLRKHICSRKEGETGRKETILNNAIKYLNHLIKQEEIETI